MFIEQMNTKKFNFILYLPIPLGFMFLMIVNYISSQGMDTEKVIHDLINQIGVNLAFVLLVGPLSFACLFLLFWVKVLHQQSIRSLTTSRPRVDWGRILFSFFLWAFITIVMVSLAYFANPENFHVNFQPVPFFTFLILAVLLIPLQTSFEEYFFRGYLMQGIGVVTKSRLWPFLITSVLFGVMHIANPEVGKMGYIIMVYYIGTGFFLGILTLMDEGLELALGFHAANNLIGALLITSDWSAFQTHSILKDLSEPSAGFDVILPVVIIFPILLFIFSKKYKWSGWKEKLTGQIPENNENQFNKIEENV
ncbi:membrane protease YdiL (CAAX protease family) [Flavobacterium arsenatis]|uniref:Membrane protease YdiL (CAAX protease family) n=1 Tax=Flavobacterium arsenatis TaxID=1484332 RepID=A0ABU1TT99_9FLAO|nr:CPBP family intramembrane glutamic endopeptidase [Flavobacterium arsenatis]MDR6969099.1 membrane protease YdiL (CAAX protease family) [Flavobacterium arsenatis]